MAQHFIALVDFTKDWFSSQHRYSGSQQLRTSVLSSDFCWSCRSVMHLHMLIFHSFINFSIYFTYWPQLWFSPFFPVPSPTSLLPTLLLCLHSDGGRPPLGVNKAWHFKLRQNQALPPAWRLSESTQHGECVPKANSNTLDRSWPHC